MLAVISSILLFTAETGGHAVEGGTQSFYDTYLNIPGFEAWKFINLAIFVLLMVYILKKPLSGAFKAKREAIRADLIKAEAEKQAALAQLTSTEAKLAALEQEKADVLTRARDEAAAEKQRIIAEAEAEAKRLREQTEGELARLSHQTTSELRRLSAEESIRLAEQKIRSQINAENDGRLVKASIDAIGGLN
ncbi:MAG: ATP synthase F0 subunit B [Acidobacteriota bacterium]